MAKTVYCVEVFDAKSGEYVHEENYPRLRDAKVTADEISMENGGVAVRVVKGDPETLTTDTMNVLYRVGKECYYKESKVKK